MGQARPRLFCVFELFLRIKIRMALKTYVLNRFSFCEIHSCADNTDEKLDS